MENICKKSERICMVDYLKALCCLLVIVNHYPWTNEQKLHPMFVFVVRMAVPVFMILSGYTFSMSATKKHQGLKELYSARNLFPKFQRFTVPVIIAFGFYLLFCAISGNGYSISEAATAFMMGDYGPGSYYYGMMLQFLIFFPLIFALIRRTQATGLVIIFIINLLFEISVAGFDVPYEDYRISLFRYFMYIAFGSYLFLNREKKLPAPALSVLFLTGLFYLISSDYLCFEWPIFQYWSWSALPVAFFIFPFVYLVLHYLEHIRIPGSFGKMLTFTGKASYHIFLVQMLYYQLELDACFNMLPTGLALLIHVSICMSLGMGYYVLENRLSTSCYAYIQKAIEPGIWNRYKKA